jgi:hypothetical protein
MGLVMIMVDAICYSMIITELMAKKTPLEKLDKDIIKLDKNIQNSNSFWKVFLRGLVSGTGTAIGASIVAAIIIGIFVQFVRTAEGLPGLKNFFNTIGLERLIQGNNKD